MTTTWTGKIDTAAAMEKVIAAARAGLADAARDVLDRSNDLVPQDTGELAASGSVEAGDDLATISYTAVQSILQHERTEYRHDDGQSKFLETAFLGGQERTAGIIGDAIRSEAGL